MNSSCTSQCPFHAIKASRIKYYDDPFFRDMLARQEGKPFPYPPSVQGVGPWGGDGGDETSADEAGKPAERAPVRDRSQRREADMPKEWEAALDRQEDFFEALPVTFMPLPV